jgi:hypothetical protein
MRDITFVFAWDVDYRPLYAVPVLFLVGLILLAFECRRKTHTKSFIAVCVALNAIPLLFLMRYDVVSGLSGYLYFDRWGWNH